MNKCVMAAVAHMDDDVYLFVIHIIFICDTTIFLDDLAIMSHTTDKLTDGRTNQLVNYACTHVAHGNHLIMLPSFQLSTL